MAACAERQRLLWAGRGLATRIAEPVRIAASFDTARFRNAPPALVEAVEVDADAESEGAAPADGESEASDADDSAAETATAEAPVGATEPEPTPAEMPAMTSASPDPAAIRAEAIAHARDVVGLCRLAGQPQMAGRFLERDTSLDEVRAAPCRQGRG
jgi:ATP-dependent Clp protease, protease subunit